jgi:hypothetical protein
MFKEVGRFFTNIGGSGAEEGFQFHGLGARKKGGGREDKAGRIQTSNEYRRRDSSVSGLIGSWFLARFAATRDVADGRA